MSCGKKRFITIRQIHRLDLPIFIGTHLKVVTRSKFRLEDYTSSIAMYLRVQIQRIFLGINNRVICPTITTYFLCIV